jgi:hypothetical protein
MTIEDDMNKKWNRSYAKTYALLPAHIKRFVDISIAACIRRDPNYLTQYRDSCPLGSDLLTYLRDVHTLRMDNGTALRTRIEFALEQGVDTQNPTESFPEELKALLVGRNR